MIVSVFCTLLMVTMCITPVFADSEDAGKSSSKVEAPPKIVSVVFDDSSSMFWDEDEAKDYWASANYATQVFAALMNPQDKLFITYMSNIYYGKDESDTIDLSDPQNAVEGIRTKGTQWLGTPLKSVKQAYDKLLSVQDSNPSTQYWLVVLTDGAFQKEYKKNGKDSPMEDFTEYANLKDAFKKIKAAPMSNGTSPRIYYFHMGKGGGNGSQDIQNDPAGGIRADYSDNIVGTLGEIANTVSGRLRYDSADIKMLDDRTAQVHSDLPLFSLSAFTQNSKAKAVSASAGGNGAASSSLSCSNVEVKSPSPDIILPSENANFKNKPDKAPDLYGNISTMTLGGNVIPSGDYTISFSDPVDAENLVLMYQPAIELQMLLYKDGSQVTDFTGIEEDDDLEIRLTAVDPSTGKEIGMGELPGDTGWEITAKKDGSDICSESGLSAKIQDIEAGDYIINARMQIPGMASLEANPVHFTVKKYSPVPKVHLTITRSGSVNEEVIYDNLDGTDRLKELQVNDRITVRAQAMDETSGNPVDASRLKASENWKIDHLLKGSVQGSKTSSEYRDITLSAGANSIVCDYTAGSLTASESVDFDVQYPAVYSLEAEKDTGSFLRKKLNGKDDIAQGPVFWILRDEDRDLDGSPDGNPVRLAKDEIPENESVLVDSVTFERAAFGFPLNLVSFFGADVKCVQNSDGSYTVYPAITGPGGAIVRTLFPYLIKTGHYKVDVLLNSTSEKKEVTVDVKGSMSDWIVLIVEIILLLIVLYALYIRFFKPRFGRGCTLNIDVYNNVNGRGVISDGLNDHRLLKPLGDHPLMPGPATVRFSSLALTVEADSQGMPFFRPKKANKDAWGKSDYSPIKFTALKNDLKNNTHDQERYYFTSDPTYFYDGAGTIYAVTLENK